MTQYVHATRTITEGEELTVSYIDAERERKRRMATLKHNWGFDCNCELCTASPAVVSESDARIRQIIHLTDVLRSGNGTPDIAELYVSLYEMERLWAAIAPAYVWAAVEWNGAGNPWKALKYAYKAVEIGLIHGGPGHVDVLDMQELIQDPTAHYSFMLRTNRKLRSSTTV